MVIQTSSIFWGDNPEGSVPNIGAKWFLGYNSTLGWSGRKCKMCFLNYMNRAFKRIQKYYGSIMKWLRKFSLNLERPIIAAAPVVYHKDKDFLDDSLTYLIWLVGELIFWESKVTFHVQTKYSKICFASCMACSMSWV